MADYQKPHLGIGTTLEASGNRLRVTAIHQDTIDVLLIETGAKVTISHKDIEVALEQYQEEYPEH
jgi:hypothetical protein